MGKTAYPTASDLALYLTGTGLFSSLPVTVAGSATNTHTVAATSRLRVGDTLYFHGAGGLRTITDIPSATTVTVSGDPFTTVVKERVSLLPASLDLATAVAAGIARFEREAGRKMLATAATERRFDLPTSQRGYLDLKADLSAFSSLSIDGTAYTLNTHFRLLSEDADEEGLPWDRVQFERHWIFPLHWSNVRAVALTGYWGYGASTGAGMPEDAWLAMLYGAMLSRLPQLAASVTRGVVNWREADVDESYGAQPLAGLVSLWREEFDLAVARYRRVTVG